jgi:hypothetical protein
LRLFKWISTVKIKIKAVKAGAVAASGSGDLALLAVWFNRDSKVG